MRILYLTDIGLTEPLGQSQVLPYLERLSARGHQFLVLSLEKPVHFAELESSVRQRTQSAGIRWVPVPYRTRPRFVAPLLNLLRLRYQALKYARQESFDWVHSRSYLLNFIALELQRRFGLRFFFDLRSFWPDERRDARLWPAGHLLYDGLYRFFKGQERRFAHRADHINCVTEAGRAWLLQAYGLPPEKVGVIPCCVDPDHFSADRILAARKQELRRELGLKPDARVLLYIGALGNWYHLEEMLRFFARLYPARPEMRFLFLTYSPPELVYTPADALGIPRAALRLASVPREKVPDYIALADVGIFFLEPGFARKMPTKVAELLAMGCPLLSNQGVGDVSLELERQPFAEILPDYSEAAFDHAIQHLDSLMHTDPILARQFALRHFALESGVEALDRIYRQSTRSIG